MMPPIAIAHHSTLTKSDSQHMDNLKYSGWALAAKVSDHEHVIDVGCGANVFKTKIKNLVGVDPIGTEADVCAKIEDYRTNIKFDVAFCLGSFRYGTKSDIEEMIKATVNLLKTSARIYWRCRPAGTGYGITSMSDPSVDTDKLFYWSEDDHVTWSKQFGFELVELKLERAVPAEMHSERIYAEWKR
jgi:hypothetical protein